MFITADILVHYIQRSLVVFQNTSSKLSRPNIIKFPPHTVLCVATSADLLFTHLYYIAQAQKTLISTYKYFSLKAVGNMQCY